MKLKIFTVVFTALIMVVIGSAFLLYTQLQTLHGINLQALENKLYTENTNILSWSLSSIDVDALGKAPLPASWAEIMVVDNESLVIGSSTSKAHAGLMMYKVPELLDQASGIIDAIKNKKPATVQTETYLVAVMPLDGKRSLLGFKPRSWEKGLIGEQNSQLSTKIASTTTLLLIYLAAGLALSFVIALVVSSIVTKPTKMIISAFEQLSLGNFDAEIPRARGKAYNRIADSFFRLRTSLVMALERLGGK